MVDGIDQIDPSCPHCGNEVDPLRAPAVSVVEGRIVHFCSLVCRASYLKRESVQSPVEAPAQVENHPGEKEPVEESSTEADVDDTLASDDVTPAAPSSRTLGRSAKFQLVGTAALFALSAGVVATASMLGVVALLAVTSALAFAANGLFFFLESERSAKKILDAVAMTVVVLAILGSVFVGADTLLATWSALLVLVIQHMGRLVELFWRSRSGVLDALHGAGDASLSPSWQNNSALAAGLKRVAIVLDWARFPAATAIAVAVLFVQEVPVEKALLAFATALLILSPRMLRMICGDAQLATAWSAASRGAVIRDARVIDHLSSSRIIVFMDRGTLFHEEMQVSDWTVAEDADPAIVLEGLASVEAKAEDRIAEAIQGFTKEKGATIVPVEEYVSQPGMGISGTTPRSAIVCGSREYLLEKEISTGAFEDFASGIESSGRRALFVALDGEVAGVIGIEETPVPGALRVNQQLRGMGLEPIMTTSAEVDTAHALGLRVGIEQVRFKTMEEQLQQILGQIEASGEGAILVGHGSVFEESLGAARASVRIGETGRTQAGVDVKSLDMVPWIVGMAKRATRSTEANAAVAAGTGLIGIALSLSWFSPSVVVFVAVCATIASVLSTVNSPYPFVSRLFSALSDTIGRAKRLIAQTKTF